MISNFAFLIFQRDWTNKINNKIDLLFVRILVSIDCVFVLLYLSEMVGDFDERFKHNNRYYWDVHDLKITDSFEFWLLHC